MQDLGGKHLLQDLYNNSLFNLLSTVYPDYDWLPWRFDRCPKDFWSNVNNQIKFVKWAANELKIKEMNDWFKITYKVKKCPRALPTY